MKSRGESRKVPAFTLIEPLVVIAIIAMLASLILPALTRAKSLAILTKCKSNEKQLGLAMRMYVGDFDVFPCFAYVSVKNRKGTIFWFDALAPYAGNAQGVAEVCNFLGTNGSVDYGKNLDENTVNVAEGSYSYNTFGTRPIGSENGGLGTLYSQLSIQLPNPRDFQTRESKVKSPSEMLGVGDGRVDFVLSAKLAAALRFISQG